MLVKMSKSKMMWLAVALEVLGVVQVYAEELRASIPPEYYGYFLIGVGVAVKVLRVYTTRPLSEK